MIVSAISLDLKLDAFHEYFLLKEEDSGLPRVFDVHIVFFGNSMNDFHHIITVFSWKQTAEIPFNWVSRWPIIRRLNSVGTD